MSYGYWAFVGVENDLLALVKLLHQSKLYRILICRPKSCLNYLQLTKENNDHTDVLESQKKNTDGREIKGGKIKNEKQEENGSKQLHELENPHKSNETDVNTSVERLLEILPQCSTLEKEETTSLGESSRNIPEVATSLVMVGGEGPTHQLMSYDEPRGSDGITLTIETEDRNSDANGKQKEIESSENEKGTSKGDAMNVSSPETKPGKEENEKRVPSLPPIFKDDQFPESLERTTVKASRGQGEGTCDIDNKDHVFSADDMMSFAWQIARGMVGQVFAMGKESYEQTLTINTSENKDFVFCLKFNIYSTATIT